MPNDEAYTKAPPSRTVEQKYKKGDLRKHAEMTAARFAKLPEWEQEMLLSRLEHTLHQAQLKQELLQSQLD